MRIVRTLPDLRAALAAWRGEGQRIAVVPTMGALHEGHLSLVRRAKTLAGRVVVTLFVNPTQFSAGEDFTLYPRNEAEDARLLEKDGADLLYAPQPEDIYAPGFSTTVTVAGLSDRWEGAFRPGHFNGVATVVTKLLTRTAPDYALFGEKDYQQLQVIRRLAADLDLPVEIVPCPIVRDVHGLALSSRNAYLTPPQLATARTLNVVLRETAQAASMGAELGKCCAVGSRRLMDEGFTDVDYLAACDASSLAPLTELDRPARLIATARLGSIRLLDNLPLDRAA